jgi:hypothetical protein
LIDELSNLSTLQVRVLMLAWDWYERDPDSDEGAFRTAPIETASRCYPKALSLDEVRTALNASTLIATRVLDSLVTAGLFETHDVEREQGHPEVSAGWQPSHLAYSALRMLFGLADFWGDEPYLSVEQI